MGGISIINVKGDENMVADKESVMRRLKIANGQLEGLIKMVESDRYCIDISNQLLATGAILKNINKDVLHAHLNSCVKNAFENSDAQEKIDEIISIMDKLSK